MKRVLFFFLLILSIHFINAQPLSQRLDALLHEEVLKTSEVGIAVFDLTTGKSVYRYQDEKLYRPASVEKIITSVTALAQLGADYTMDTGLRYRGKIENDTLKGSLYLAGAKGMEPGTELTAEDLAAMERKSLEAVKERGKASVGDKTMVDALEPAVEAMEAACHKGLLEMLKEAEKAAYQGVENTKGQLAKYGRAKSLLERAIGHQDAGATSVAIIFRSMREFVEKGGK